MKTGTLAGWMVASMALAGATLAQSTEALSTEDAFAVPESAPRFDDANGPDSALAGTRYGYLRIAGSSFVARYAGQAATYSSAGCIQAPAAGAIYVADIQLPADADVRFVRTYYYNNGIAGEIKTFFTEYDGIGAFTEHTSFPTTQNGGFASDLSPPIAVTINPIDRSYAMVVNIGASSPSFRFCGVRIQYFY